MNHELEMPDVVKSGVADGGMVGVKTTRWVKSVDSECWTWMRRVARAMEVAERRAREGVMVSEDSREALI